MTQNDIRSPGGKGSMLHGDLTASGRWFRRLRPDARMCCGFITLLACLILNPARLNELFIIILAVVGFRAIVGKRFTRRFVAVTCAIVCVAMSFAGLGQSTVGLPYETVVALFSVLVRITFTLLVVTSLMHGITIAEGLDVIRAAPVPAMVRLLLFQIVHHVHRLARQTKGMVNGIAVRGASASLPAAIRLVRNIPAVWLPRVIAAALRSAVTMEVRQFDLPEARLPSIVRRDVLALCGFVIFFLACLGIHMAGMR